ncbi:MAG: HAD family hydrolase [Anaerolineae bacterium]
MPESEADLEQQAPLRLRDLRPVHRHFVGIDSDGCVFDTMECKHKECFIPSTIKHWGLQAVSRYAREAAEFVNLYSIWRGTNRWPALVKTLDLLRERPEVRQRGVAVPELVSVRQFIAAESTLSNETLTRRIAETGDPELERALAWSRAVNAAIADIVSGIAPFVWARRSLVAIAAHADAVVVSQTPTEALSSEWREHAIDGYARAIAGQELGSKAQHLAEAAGDKYAAGRKLMIGDAPGDLDAACANGCLFFPIVPGQEEASWQQLYEEGLRRFLDGSYAGAYEDGLISAFTRALPKIPPWQRQA